MRRKRASNSHQFQRKGGRPTYILSLINRNEIRCDLLEVQALRALHWQPSRRTERRPRVLDAAVVRTCYAIRFAATPVRRKRRRKKFEINFFINMMRCERCMRSSLIERVRDEFAARKKRSYFG